MTPFVPEDRFNLLERATVHALCKKLFRDETFDPIGFTPDPTKGIGGYAFSKRDWPADWPEKFPKVRTIHTKINRDPEQEPKYFDPEMPAIGVSCTGQPSEDRQTLRKNLIRITVILDIVTYSGDMAACDTEMSRIAGEVQSFIAEMMGDLEDPLDGYFTGASGGGHVESDGVVGLSTRYREPGWVGEAATTFTAAVRDPGFTQTQS